MDSPNNGPDSDVSAPTSKIVPISYLVAALINVLFIKGLAVTLPVPLFGAVMAALSPMLATTFATLTLQALAASAAAARVRKGYPPGFTQRVERRGSLLVGAAILAALGFYFTPGIADALRLPSPSYSASIPLLAAIGVLFGVASGTVLGAGKDVAFAGMVMAEPVLRCIATVAFIHLGLGGFAPLLAMLASTTTSVLVSRRVLPALVQDEPEPTAKEALLRHRLPLHPFASAASQLALLCFGALVFVDVPVVRYLLDEDAAGRFAGVATASRFLLLLPFPIALVLVVRVRQRLNRREQSHGDLLRAIASLAIPVSIALLLIHAFPSPVLGLFLDSDKYADDWSHYPRYAIAAALYGVALLLLFYGIAAGRISLAALPLVAAVLKVVLLAENGSSIGNCVTVVQTMAILFLVVLAAVVLVPLLWTRR